MADAQPLVAVVDYGIGNLHSAQKALDRLGADARLTADPALIADADGRRAARRRGVRCVHGGAARAPVSRSPCSTPSASGRPFLGICVGMQMLFDASEEDPGASGLGVIPGTVRWLPAGRQAPADAVEPRRRRRRPTTRCSPGSATRPWFYFVHSLHGVPDDPAIVAATCDYGGPVNAAFRRGNVFATQFHPEKSAAAGLGLLGNFVAALPRCPLTTVLYPSIDLRGGQVVRLRQGDYAARDGLRRRPGRGGRRRSADAGATWIHVVDLDAARSGEPRQPPVVARDRGGRRRTGAGPDRWRRAHRRRRRGAADAGVARVVMGSAAVARTPSWSTTSPTVVAGGRRARPPPRRARRARLDRGQPA